MAEDNDDNDEEEILKKALEQSLVDAGKKSQAQITEGQLDSKALASALDCDQEQQSQIEEHK